jgi:hypothetical protein
VAGLRRKMYSPWYYYFLFVLKKNTRDP